MAERLTTEEPRHIRIYHEDDGFVLWWKRPVDEPPYVGSPLCSDWPGYHQWWTPLPPIPVKLLPKHEQRRLAASSNPSRSEGIADNG